MSKHVCNVQHYLYRLKCVWSPQLKKGEGIVNKAHGIVYGTSHLT